MNTQVIEFLTNTPNSNKTAISEATGIKGLPLFNLLKSMLKDGQLVSTGEGTETTYSIAEPQSEEVVTDGQPTVEQAATPDAGKEETPAGGEQTDKEEQPASPDENNESAETKGNEQQVVKATPAATTSTRDNSKYKFNGEEYGKGPLVRAVIAKYIADHPDTTYKQLKEVFPDTLMKRFGVFASETEAKKLSGNKPRYFLKPEQLIKIKGQKEPLAVCNQWTAGLMVNFLNVCKGLSYKIK